MKNQRVAQLFAAASVAVLAAGCGGDGSNLIEGDTTFNVDGGAGGTGGGGSGGGGNDGGNGNGGGGMDDGQMDPDTGMMTSGTDPDQNGGFGNGGGFAQGGFLYNQNIHPLRAEIDTGFMESGRGVGSAITPASQADCPDGTSDTGNTVTIFADTPAFPVCRVNDNLNGDGTTYTLTNDHVYLLTSAVRVGNGFTQGLAPADAENVTLNIEAGTQIFAQAFSGGVGGASIRITRGSDININGTLEQPVIMSAAIVENGRINNPTNFTGLGQWGGLIIDGYAPTNQPGNEILSEAAPVAQQNFFGGSLPEDNSGSINYVVIGETGVTIAPDQEVQGMTLEGVGSGTTINHVQVFGSDDDGIEWFGGTVNVSNVIISGMSDDGLDIDQGYTGTIKNVIVRQGTDRGNNTIEADGNGDGFDRTPVTRPNISNVLLIGASSQNPSEAMLAREGFGGDLENTVATDASALTNISSGAYLSGCFLLRDQVDTSLQAAGLIFNCTNDAPNGEPGQAQGDPNLYPTWFAGNSLESGATGQTPGGFVGAEDNDLTVDAMTYVVTTTVDLQPQTSGTDDGLQADPYFGAVNPTDGQNGTEFFRGWTVSVANP